MELIKDFFKVSIEMVMSYGVKKEKIVFDLGVGFGKDFE